MSGTPELSEMLKELSRARGLTATVIHDERWSAAVEAIEDYFRTLQKEIERLRLIQFSPSGDNHHNAALCPYCNPKQIAERDKLIEEIRALRSTSLTPEEATYLEDDVHLSHQFTCKYWHDEACDCLIGSISEKLRVLTGETAT